MKVKKKSRVTKAMIAASFFITIVAIISPVIATGSNRFLFIAIGDDLDFPETTNIIIGKVDSSGDSSKLFFHQRIHDESSKKVYSMVGMLKDGSILTTEHYFYCPIFNVWFINVWLFKGMGVFKTSDTDYDLVYRNWFPITMPNTESKFVEAPIIMLLSPTAEYCLEDPNTYPPGEYPEIFILPGGAWVLPAVLCGIIVETPAGPMELPIGPVSYLTRFIEV